MDSLFDSSMEFLQESDFSDGEDVDPSFNNIELEEV
jgi:hypothetical protein